MIPRRKNISNSKTTLKKRSGQLVSRSAFPKPTPPSPLPTVDAGDYGRTAELLLNGLHETENGALKSTICQDGELLRRTYLKLRPDTRLCLKFVSNGDNNDISPEAVHFPISRHAAWNLCFSIVLSEDHWPDIDESFIDKVERLFNSLVPPLEALQCIVCLIEPGQDPLPTGKETLYTTQNHWQTIELGSLLFSENSLQALELYNFKGNTSPLLKGSYKNLRLYLDYVKEHFSYVEFEKFLLYSGYSIFISGARAARDIDLCVGSLGNKDFDQRVRYWIQTAEGSRPNEGFPIDILMEGPSDPIWHRWTNFSPPSLDKSTLSEVVHDKNFYFFFKGLKIMTLEKTIAERIARVSIIGGMGAFSDLLMLRELFPTKYKLPKLPQERTFYRRKQLTSEHISLDEYFYSISSVLHKKYGIRKSFKEIKEIYRADNPPRPLSDFGLTAPHKPAPALDKALP